MAGQAVAADGPPLFTKALQSRNSVGRFDPAEGAWPLSQSQRGLVTLSQRAQTQAPTLACTYRRPGDRDTYRGVTLWANNRPDLSQVSEADLNSMSGVKASLDADIAISQCPPSWGAALALVWGPNAMADIEELIAKRERRNQDNEARWEEQQRKKGQDKAKIWQAAAAALPPTTAAQDRALVQQIDSEIGAMEANLDGLNSRPFDTALRNGLSERIIRLGQVAWVKSKGLSASGPNRARFDAWDNNLGGPALMAVYRIEKILYYRTNRRFKLAEIPRANEASAEMASWKNVDYSSLWPGRAIMLEIMTQQLAGKQLVNPEFLKRVARDLARDRPRGDPGQPFYRSAQVEGKSWVMSGPQQQLEEKSGSTAVSSAVNAAGAVGDMVRLIEKMDADVRNARKAFWQCYATNCKDAAKAFYAYSHAMTVKDEWFFMRPFVMPGLLAPGMAMVGDENIDGGLIEGCSAESNALNGAMAPAARMRQSNPIAATALVAEVMAGPKYDAWGVCRDRMEYVFRPRF